MVVDTLAVAAILFGEPDAPRYISALEDAPSRLVSAVTRVELAFVVEGRKGEAGRLDLERLLDVGGFEVVAVTSRHSAIAIEAFRRFGKGRHPAGLNIGDCFSYALARASGLPLLFKGEGFSRTDVAGVLGD